MAEHHHRPSTWLKLEQHDASATRSPSFAACLFISAFQGLARPSSEICEMLIDAAKIYYAYLLSTSTIQALGLANTRAQQLRQATQMSLIALARAPGMDWTITSPNQSPFC